jgi:preprotein translocase subunit SecG
VYTFVLIIHLIVCFFLIFIVLIQSSKGAEMGAAFGGGSSQTIFGSRGAATVLTKITTISAILFMLTSLTLAVVTINRGSIMLNAPAAEAPAEPFSGAPSGPLQDRAPVTVEESQAEVPVVPTEPAE